MTTEAAGMYTYPQPLQPTQIRTIIHRRTRESIDNKANGFAATEQSHYSESAEKPEDDDGHRVVHREKGRDKSHHHNCQEALVRAMA
jgi:hypothetical protein